jgi:ABC-2 type transport system ATP-binding protein
MSDGPAVEAHGLVRRFGDDAALREVSFEVAPGELYGVIGPDGAGKTTLFRILVTLLLPDAGTARVLGRDVVKDLWNLRTRIGYMPGRFSLYPDLSVAENLSFFAALFDTTVAEARETIAPIWVQLERFSARRAGALSGGMKQKLALCCALVHRPEILFLDEPTTGVDAVSRREFWDLLARLRDDGLPIVVSTPYMDEATRCDRVSLMQAGRLLVTDRPDAIGAGYPRPLLAVRGGGDILGLLGALRRFPHAAAVWPFGEALHYTDARPDAPADAIARELAGYLQTAGLHGVTMAPIPASIEDAFMWYMAQEHAA